MTLLHDPSPSATPDPWDNYVSSSQFLDTYQVYILALSAGVEPTHYKDVVLNENWRFAIKDEIVACEVNGTWTVEDLPP